MIQRQNISPSHPKVNKCIIEEYARVHWFQREQTGDLKYLGESVHPGVLASNLTGPPMGPGSG